jgi:hypothetical protein
MDFMRVISSADANQLRGTLGRSRVGSVRALGVPTTVAQADSILLVLEWLAASSAFDGAKECDDFVLG